LCRRGGIGGLPRRVRLACFRSALFGRRFVAGFWEAEILGPGPGLCLLERVFDSLTQNRHVLDAPPRLHCLPVVTEHRRRVRLHLVLRAQVVVRYAVDFGESKIVERSELFGPATPYGFRRGVKLVGGLERRGELYTMVAVWAAAVLAGYKPVA